MTGLIPTVAPKADLASVISRLNSLIQDRNRFPDIAGGARPGEYSSRVVGDAIESLVDGSVTGTDNTAAHRKEWLEARELGQSLFIPPGNYIWSDSIVRTGEAFDNCGIRGIPGVTRIYRKIAGQPGTFTLLNFDGTLEVDATNTSSPSYYFTVPAVAGATTAQLNTLTGLSKGMWLMLIDRTHPVNHWSVYPEGVRAGTFGQKVQIQSIDAVGPFMFTIQSSTYDEDTNLLTITTQLPAVNYIAGEKITLSGLTGTGDFALLEGEQTAVIPTAGRTTTIFVGDIDPTTTLTSGTISYGVASPNSIYFLPKLEANYAGTSTSPNLNSTLIRRFSRSPENIRVEGLIFDWDKTQPSLSTHSCITWSALVRPKSRFNEFYGVCVGHKITNGTHDFSISEFFFDEGGPLQYANTVSTGSSYGRIYNGSCARGRHLTNTTADISTTATTCTPAHIQTANVQAYSYYFAPFTDHPGVRNLSWINCTAVGCAYSGFSLRGVNERVIGCSAYGSGIGVDLAFAENPVVDGGLYVGNGIGIQFTRCIGPRVINFPVFRDSREADILTDMTDTDDLTVAMPGVFVEADVTNSSPYLANVVVTQKNANFAPVFANDWRFKVRASGRAPTFAISRPSPITATISAGTYDTGTGLATITTTTPIIYQAGDTVTLSALTGTGAFASLNGKFPTRTPTSGYTTTIYAPGLGALTLTGGTISFGLRTTSFYPFPLEFAGLVSRKYRDFTVVPGLDADYEMDTSADNVSTTMPASGVFPNQRVTFSKPNIGGNTATINGVIGSDTNPTLADEQIYRVCDSGKRFPIVSGTYNNVNGLVTLNMRDAMPWALANIHLPAGINIVVSGLTGTGAFASLEGAQVTLATGTNSKTVFYTDSTGLGAITITGGFLTVDGWTKR